MFAGLADLVARHGYAMVVLFVGAEGLGIPLPGETALVIAAAIASRGRLSPLGVITAGAVGAILGGTGGYWLGRAGGAVLARGPALERGRRFFERYGAPSVFLGRFVALLRTVVGMLAGASGMPFARFSFYNALGAVVWAAVVGGGGFLFGRSLPRLRGLGRAGLVGALFVSLLVALVVGWRWLRANRARLELAVARLGRWYLAWHQAVGLLCGLATIFAFGAVTESVFSRHPLTAFDVMLAGWLETHAPTFADRAAGVLGTLGGPGALTLVGVGTGAILLLRRRWLDVAVWGVAAFGAVVLDAAVGLVVRRPPAPAADTLALAAIGLGGGDAVGAALIYGMLAYFTASGLRSRAARTAVTGGAALLIAAVALSRLLLGAQYFSGLITGYAAALVWVSACLSGLELAPRPVSRPSS